MVRQYYRVHQDFDTTPRTNEEGDYLCVNCGRSLAFNKRRSVWCSSECELEYHEKHTDSWGIIRARAFERDDFTCQVCGVHVEFYPIVNFNSSNMAIGDHIQPIWEGGAEFDLDNVQTLCYRCSQKKTKVEAVRRAKLGKDLALGIQKRLSVKGA